MEAIRISFCIFASILLSECSFSKPVMFKKVKEVPKMRTVSESLSVSSAIKCSAICLKSRDCVGFQIKKEATAASHLCNTIPDEMVICDIMSASEGVQHGPSEHDYYKLCPEICFKGEVRDNDGCACIIRKNNKEYKWKAFQMWNLDDDLATVLMWSGVEDERSCKERCLMTENCLSLTLAVVEHKCDLTVASLQDPNFKRYELARNFVTYGLVPV